MSVPRRVSPQLLAEIHASEERRLTPEEFEARVNAPWTAQEAEDFDALVRWFRTRYPTAGERMRAIRLRMAALRRRQAAL